MYNVKMKRLRKRKGSRNVVTIWWLPALMVKNIQAVMAQ